MFNQKMRLYYPNGAKVEDAPDYFINLLDFVYAPLGYYFKYYAEEVLSGKSFPHRDGYLPE